MSDTPRRQPQLFDPADPRLRASDPTPQDDPLTSEPPPEPAPRPSSLRVPTVADLQRGINWGLWLAGSAISLLIMSFALRFWSFVWDLFQRQDWIGWVAVVLAGILVLSLTMLIAREVIGVFRLAKLQQLRKQSETSLQMAADAGVNPTMVGHSRVMHGNNATNRSVAETVTSIRDLYADRPELAWARARLADHDRTIMSSTERLALLDRELLAAVDDQAKAAIAQSARRVSVVTAITPFAIFDMGFVLYENLRMLRRIATIYGGRPGYAALFRLASRVIAYVVASGGLALTDDLFGQFVGQGLAKRLSARAGQGMFNGGLTVRLGVAAIDLTRPLPFIEARKPRFRELALDVARGLTVSKTDGKSAT